MNRQREVPHTERWAYKWLYTDRIFRFTTALYPVLRRRGFHWVSRSVAGIYAHSQHGVVEVVRRNLDLLRPSNRLASARRVFRNYATVIADYVAVGAMREDDAGALCGEFIGREHIEAAWAGGRGAVLATGHYGFFEYGCVVLGRMGVPVTAATLPEPSDALTQWRADWRRRWGVQTVEVGADPFSSLAVNRSLNEGRMVAVLADRPMEGHGLEVAVPGGRTLFSTTPAMLASMTGAPIVPVTVALQADGHYRMTAMQPIEVPRVGGSQRREEIARCTQLLAAALFGEMVSDPEQWFQFVPVVCD